MNTFTELFAKFCKKDTIKRLDEDHQILLFQIFMDSYDDGPPRRGKKR